MQSLIDVGWNEHWQKSFAVTALSAEDYPARVVRHDGVALMIQSANELVQVRINLTEAPTVGDWVVISGGVANAIVPRISLLRRLDPDGTSQQLLAANVDLVMIVLALDRPLSQNRLQQALQLVLDSGAEPLVVLSKSDAHDDAESIATAIRDRHPEVQVVTISVKLNDGVDDLLRRATNRTVVLLGESGAGKSTITNGLIGDEVAPTSEVSARNALGRHTTTTRELRPLPAGGVLIDSPGIRSFASFEVEDSEVSDTQFEELDEIAEECRFNNCSHGNEPGCAITAALASGQIKAADVRVWKVHTNTAVAKAEAVVTATRAEKKRSRRR